MQINNYFDSGKALLDIDDDSENESMKNFLDLLLKPDILSKIYGDKNWEQLIYDLILKSNFNVKTLIDRRSYELKSKTLFTVIKDNNYEDYTYLEVKKIVESLSNKLLFFKKEKKFKVAILSENCIEMVFADLACLYGGIVDILIPPNISEEHINYILEQSKPGMLFVQNEKLFQKIRASEYFRNVHLQVIVLQGHAPTGTTSYKSFCNEETTVNVKMEIKIGITDLATIMYTSGTTGEPKGIMFSNANIVFKRFCRAIALPKIGRNDVFLSYLPLFHTFGRYLEMMGAIFWGARYVFAENPSIFTLIKNMQEVKPTIFISIPKKWVQLYDYISQSIDIEISHVVDVKDKLSEVTGGKLEWGLSAAGYLSPDIFYFFRKHGVNLLSGFGMTEATGGITMTPPNKYKENSIGIPLPGIETKLSEENELLIRGKYVMKGYFGTRKKIFFEDGWFPTGDIMKIDEENFHFIFDRKKDIYKNSRGETIAPQKIENYFLESDFVKQVFLVGDHKPYNTLLIFPDTENNLIQEHSKNNQKIQEIFESIVVSINQFLPKHERIIDFRIIDRPFSVELEEITPKNTLKRWIVERNFAFIIEEMYKKNSSSFFVGKYEVIIPTWFFKENGFLTKDISYKNNEIINRKNDKRLFLSIGTDNTVQIGSFKYYVNGSTIELQDIITEPSLWIGNFNLVEFFGDSIVDWIRQEKNKTSIKFFGISRNINKSETENYNTHSVSVNPLISVHISFCLIYSEEELSKLYGINYLKTLIQENSIIFGRIPKELFFRLDAINNTSVLHDLFKIAIQNFSVSDFKRFILMLLDKQYNFFDKKIIEFFSEQASTEKLEAIEEIIDTIIKSFPVDGNLRKSSLPSLLELLTYYGVNHPTKYIYIRQTFVKYQVFGKNTEVSLMASLQRKKMRDGFREWLGKPMIFAVDIDANKEYRWKDVLVFDETVSSDDKLSLIDAISTSNIIKESVFFFSKGILINLNNILPSGIKISQISYENNRKTFLVSILTRFQGTFLINISQYSPSIREELFQEFNWRILAGSRYIINELVDDFGGIWDEYNMFTSNYLKSTTVRQQLERHIKSFGNLEYSIQLQNMWHYYIWNCSAVFFNFLRLTNMKYIVSPSSIDSFYVPEHDYHTGNRLVSFSNKVKFTTIYEAIKNFSLEFLKPVSIEFPFLESKEQLYFVFSGLVNAFGEEEGLKLLNNIVMIFDKSEIDNIKEDLSILQEYISEINDLGYFPKQLYFAVQRFKLWHGNNKTASLSAIASFINDLFETYSLSSIVELYPYLKIRFYLETVFAQSSYSLRKSLLDIVKTVRKKKVPKEYLINELINLKNLLILNSFEEFFITRLSYPYLKPDDTAQLLKTTLETGNETNLTIKVEDSDKFSYFIRKPVNPKEINRLYQLFLDSDLQVTFQSYHSYLIIVNEQGFVIGGLFYFYENQDTVKMEKIVISRKFRGKGLSDILMKDFISRILLNKIKYLVTGYFRPNYFEKFGFKLDNRFGGLVKILE